MDETRFDQMSRLVYAAPSRRDLLTVITGFAFGAVPIAILHVADAKKKKRKKKKKPLPLNAFGCVNVGQRCAGNSANCCSGICQGKKPKKGKKDKSRCVDHDADICSAVNDSCTAGVSVPCGGSEPCGRCVLTTGNAGFCSDTEIPASSLCRLCKKDTDCEAELGEGAVCIVLGGACASSCPGTGGTACFPPTACG